MAIEGFNYKEFSQMLSNQAVGLLPENFEDFQKNYVINTIKNFAELSGEAIYNDTQSGFTLDQAMLITQIIAEWSFHKSVDIIKAGILPDYWDGIMQKIAFTIFEIAKQSLLRGVKQDDVLQIVEQHVKKAYEEVLNELKTRQIIDENTFNTAIHQSNIDDLMQKMQEEKETEQREAEIEQANHQANSKILKLASIALLLKQMPEAKVKAILKKFKAEDANSVLQYMQMPDLETKVDMTIAMRCLNEIKSNLPEPKFIAPEKIMEKMSLLFKTVPRAKIDKIISNEREGVKEFIKKASDGDYPDIPTKVANIIAQHLEENAS